MTTRPPVTDEHAQQLADAELDLAEVVRRKDPAATRRAVRRAVETAGPAGLVGLLVAAAHLLPVDGRVENWWAQRQRTPWRDVG